MGKCEKPENEGGGEDVCKRGSAQVTVFHGPQREPSCACEKKKHQHLRESGKRELPHHVRHQKSGTTDEGGFFIE